MLEDVLREFNPWWDSPYEPPGILRKRYVSEIERLMGLERVILVFGLRRVGKSFILKQFVSKMTKDVGPDKVFYAAMDHPMLGGTSILDLLSEFRRINKVDRMSPHFLLLDEVHHRKDFEWELKALADADDGLRVVAAGSSSLVIRHKSAAMTGRYLKVQVFPLDFAEYLGFTGHPYDPQNPALMAGLMDEYLVIGGMPKYVLTKEPQVLLNIIDDVIFKDIVNEYGIDDGGRLKDLFYLMMDRVGRPLSYEKIGRLIGVSGDTATKYIDHFQETYLLNLCEKAGTPNEGKRGPKKVYCPDNGFRVIMTGTRGAGALAENLVYNILSNGQEIKYTVGDGSEVDFLTKDTAVEVKYRDIILEEDVKPFISKNIRGIKHKILVTQKGIDIKGLTVVPLWRFAYEASQGRKGEPK